MSAVAPRPLKLFGFALPAFGGAGPLVFARLISAVVTFAIPLVLARVMNLEEYGSYKQVFLVAMVLYHVLPAGMPQALFYFVPRSDERRPFYAHTLGFLLVVGGGLSLLLLGALAGPLAGLMSSPDLLEHKWPLALYVIGLTMSYPLEISLTSEGKKGRAAFFYVASDVLKVVAMLAPVLLGLGLGGMLWGLVAFVAVRTLVTLVTLLGGSRGPLFDRTLLLQQVAYAAPFAAAVLIAVPQQQAHAFAVSASVSAELFAIYAVGCTQLPIVEVLYTPTSEVLMVKLGELERAGRMREAVQAFRDASVRLARVFLPFAAFLALASEDFIGLIFGEKFLAAAPIFRVTLVGAIVSILPIDGVLRATNRTNVIFRSRVMKLIVTVPALYLGIRYFGMMGGICAWALAELVGKWVMLRRVPEALGMGERLADLRHVLPGRHLAHAAITSLIAVGAAYAFRQMLPESLNASFFTRGVAFGAMGAVFTLTYAGLLRMSGLIGGRGVPEASI